MLTTFLCMGEAVYSCILQGEVVDNFLMLGETVFSYILQGEVVDNLFYCTGRIFLKPNTSMTG